jgi:hypothetical protein
MSSSQVGCILSVPAEQVSTCFCICQLCFHVCLPRLREFFQLLLPERATDDSDRIVFSWGSIDSPKEDTRMYLSKYIFIIKLELARADPKLLVGQLHVLETRPLRVVLGLAGATWHRSARGAVSRCPSINHTHNHTPDLSIKLVARLSQQHGQGDTVSAREAQVPAAAAGSGQRAAASSIMMSKSPDSWNSRSRRIFTNGLPIARA